LKLKIANLSLAPTIIGLRGRPKENPASRRKVIPPGYADFEHREFGKIGNLAQVFERRKPNAILPILTPGTIES
jgi:hypothetical protein